MMKINTMNIDDLKSGNKIWIAATGKLENYKWYGLIIPTETTIKRVVKTDASFLHYASDNVTVELEYFENKRFSFDLDSYGNLQKKFHIIMGLYKTDISEWWINQIKILISDRWSGINETKSNLTLKRYLIENEYEYFSKNYPELLI